MSTTIKVAHKSVDNSEQVHYYGQLSGEEIEVRTRDCGFVLSHDDEGCFVLTLLDMDLVVQPDDESDRIKLVAR